MKISQLIGLLVLSLSASSLHAAKKTRADIRPEMAGVLGEAGYRVYPDGVIIHWETCQDILLTELNADYIDYDEEGRLTMLGSQVDLEHPFPLWVVDALNSLRIDIWAIYKTPPQNRPITTAFRECFEDHRKEVDGMGPESGLTAFLEERGFMLKADGEVLDKRTGARISAEAFKELGLALNAEGRPAKFGGLEKGSQSITSEGKPLGDPIEIWVPSVGQTELSYEETANMVSALLGIQEAGGLDPGFVGAALHSWGVLPAVDGHQLINPDGTATTMGILLYQGLSRNIDNIEHVSVERVADSLIAARAALLGRSQGDKSDLGSLSDLGRSWDGLGRARMKRWEIAFDLKPYPSMKSALQGYKARLSERAGEVKGKHGKGQERADLRAALKALNELERHRYHTTMKMPEIPAPALDHGKTLPPRARYLPALLRSLNKIAPLSGEQAEALVKSFPMGESVWRMGAQKLWSQGLTGKGVKIGVIDSGIELHREFEGVVKERRDVTGTGGTTPGKTHATHVAGTIHALAPEAEIRSYKVFDPNDGGMAKDAGVLRAIDDAVADGNNVINLSLGGPADAFKREKRRLLSRINKYSRQGVIFVIASGNGRAYGDEGVTSPSVAREAVSAGALDIADRMTDFTQYGPTYDATTGKKSIKRIFLTPGKHVVSSVGKKDYQGMSGTSMAAPHLTGSFGLLVGGLLEMGGLMSPRAVARAVKEAVVVSARPLKERPADAGDREEFVIVDPTMAYARLTASRPR